MTTIVAISEPGRGRPAKRRPFLRSVFHLVVDRGMARETAARSSPPPAILARYISPVQRLAD